MSSTNDAANDAKSQHAASRLYDGEVLAEILGHPCMYKYLPTSSHTSKTTSDSLRPLMVFVPGAAHLARMAYGVPSHSAHDPSDFLAHHLNNFGYPFLGISYPLESAEPDSATDNQNRGPSTPSLMPATSYDFRITDWGKQAAEVTAKVVSDQRLSKNIVLIVWSMGGRMVNPYTSHARSLGLNVRVVFPLAASPGLQTANLPVKNTKVSKNGYAKVGLEYEEPFLQQMHIQRDQCDEGRDVFPDEVWRRDYFGYCPVALMGWKLRSIRYDTPDKGPSFKFAEDEWQGFIDSDTPNVSNYPNWIVSIYSDSMMDAKHGLVDRAIWGSLLAQQILNRVEGVMAKHRKSGKSLSGEGWQRLMQLVDSLPEQLSQKLPGTHFFFLGRTGAQRTAATIDRLFHVATQLESELGEILEDFR